jgi:hypothetical protein
MIGIIRAILHKTFGPSLGQETADKLSGFHYDNIQNGTFDFSSYTKKKLTQNSSIGKKHRTVYSFEKYSTEYILCKYLKDRIDRTFDIEYADRKKVIKILFNTLPVLNGLNDFVLIRFDFKGFFDSVSTDFIYQEYIENSLMKRKDKNLFKNFCSQFNYCYAGLPTSNSMTELACKDFDKTFRSKLNDYGVVYFERYIDDVLIILNKYILEKNFLNILQEAIISTFKKCNVEINKSQPPPPKVVA